MCKGFKGRGQDAGQKGAGLRARKCWARTGGQEATGGGNVPAGAGRCGLFDGVCHGGLSFLSSH